MKSNRKWLTFLLFAVVVTGAYFINVEVQSYLGQKVLKNTGLQVLSLTEASALAANESKLVLAVSSAIWCPSCRKLDKQVFSDQGVLEDIERGFVYARIEYESDEGKAFLERYDLTGFPNILVLEPSGKLIRKVPLTFDPETFRKNLESAVSG
jgi:thiol:disulfide interchange protein